MRIDPSLAPSLQCYLDLAATPSAWSEERYRHIQKLMGVMRAVIREVMEARTGGRGFADVDWLVEDGDEMGLDKVKKWLNGPFWIGVMR